MKQKLLITVILAFTLLFVLSGCKKAEVQTATDGTNYSSGQTNKNNNSDVQSKDNSSKEEETDEQKEPWKVTFEKSLLENYQAVPEYYEDLGDGIYQVYVKIDGKVVPYVTVNSKTGDYHG